MPEQSGYRAPAIARALTILEMVSESQQGLGISELARRMGISKGTVHGLCRQLEAGGALIRDPDSKRFGLGPLVDTLARRGYVLARLRQAAAPELSRLSSELQVSVFLGVLVQDHVTILDSHQPSGRIGVNARPGARLPLTAGAVGQVFLAGLPPARVEKVIKQGLQRFTPHTTVDPEEYRRRIGRVRQSGVAYERDEYLVGLWGAAASLGSQWGAVAAIWTVGFTSALEEGGLEAAAKALEVTARRIDAAKSL